MQYFTEALNRETGELEVVDLGEWLTISEFGEQLGKGPREVRTVLHEMNFLQPETSAKSRHTRMRICQWVVDEGWGKRIERKGRVPFDTISPAAQQWIRKGFEEAEAAIEDRTSEPARQAAAALQAFIEWRVAERVNVEENFTTGRKFSWLADHYPDLTQGEMGSVRHVTPQLVSKLAIERKKQITAATRCKTRTLPLNEPRSTMTVILIRAHAEGRGDEVFPLWAHPLDSPAYVPSGW